MRSLEYVAGYFDGEGYIGVHKATNKNGSISYGTVVTVTNSYLPMITELQQQFGGRVWTRVATEKHRTTFVWEITGKYARAFLATLLPHLNEKKPQAELALSLPHKHSQGKGRAFTPEYRQQQEDIYLEIRRLKHIDHCCP